MNIHQQPKKAHHPMKLIDVFIVKKKEIQMIYHIVHKNRNVLMNIIQKRNNIVMDIYLLKEII